jgi:hypothetical protein
MYGSKNISEKYFMKIFSSQVDHEAKIFRKTTADLRLLTGDPQLLRQTSGYHERLLRLIRGGGILAYDNTL